jgi:CDP-glucose 4,6-dehydratase
MKKDIFNNAFLNKRVLVTGDTGFKGSWLCVWLSMLGARVSGLSLPAKGHGDNFTRARLAKTIRHFDGDVCDFSAVEKIFSAVRPQIVFHLAAQALVIESYARPRETFSTNVLGTLNVLDACKNLSSVKAIVNVTSDKCYDNKEWVHGYRESDPLGGKDPYSASKAASEIVSAAYSHSFFCKKGAPAIATARAGNVIGGGDWAQNRIVPDCIRALESGTIISLRNPHATRPWQHVLEPLRGYLLLAKNLLAEGATWSGAWNFGPLQANTKTVETLVRHIVKQWGNGALQPAKTAEKPHEAGQLNLDISKALHFLSWRPVLDFNDTVRWTVDEYRAMHQTKNVYDVMKHEISAYTDKVLETLETKGAAHGAL